MKNRKEKLIILGCSIGLIATLFIGNIKSNALEGKNIKKGVFESVFLLNRETDLINKNILINDITEKKTKKYIYDSVNYNQYNLTEKSNITEEDRADYDWVVGDLNQSQTLLNKWFTDLQDIQEAFAAKHGLKLE